MLGKIKPVKWINVLGVEGDRLVYQPTAWSLKPRAIRINVALSFRNPLMYSAKWKRKNVPEVRECHDSLVWEPWKCWEPNPSIWQHKSQETAWPWMVWRNILHTVVLFKMAQVLAVSCSNAKLFNFVSRDYFQRYYQNQQKIFCTSLLTGILKETQFCDISFFLCFENTEVWNANAPHSCYVPILLTKENYVLSLLHTVTKLQHKSPLENSPICGRCRGKTGTFLPSWKKPSKHDHFELPYIHLEIH